MPPRKSNVSTTSNGGEEGAESTPAKTSKEKDGLSVEDLSLPKSMIARLAKGVLPPNTQIQKDALLALHKSATVFVSYIASNSSENAQASGKKTIMPPDVMAAIKDAEFDDFLPRLEAELKKYNETQCDKRNTYRRKVKEEKAAAATENPDEAPKEGESAEDNAAPTGVTNGHVNGHAQEDDEDRPMKKLKAENGDAISPDADGMDEDDENEAEAEEEGEQEADDQTEDEEEDDDDEADDDDDDENDRDETVEDPDPDSMVTNSVHDEVLEDSDSD